MLRDYIQVCERICEKWTMDERKQPSLRTMIKPVLNLFVGEKHGRKWKAVLDQELKTATTMTELIEKSLPILPQDVLDRPPETSLLKENVTNMTEQLIFPALI